jgi:alpha-tubulin suppressor-like RCC1 family protein
MIDFSDNLWVFGKNDYGQLASGDNKNILLPTKIDNFKVKCVSAGRNHTVLLDFNNNVWVCGENSHGQLGLGDNIRRSIPIKIPNFRAKSIVAGDDYTIALDFNDEVWTFGDNYRGQLGLGNKNSVSIPTKIPSEAFGLPGFKVKSIFAGEQHPMAIDFNSDVWAFGNNNNDALGLGDTRDRLIPEKIPNFKAKDIAIGSWNTVAISDYHFKEK